MINEQINRRLHEIMGLCNNGIHSIKHHVGVGNVCNNCHRLWGDDKVPSGKGYDFFTWQGFGILWEFMQKHDRWGKFMHAYYKKDIDRDDSRRWQSFHEKCVPEEYISPRPFAEAMVRFFEEEKCLAPNGN